MAEVPEKSVHGVEEETEIESTVSVSDDVIVTADIDMSRNAESKFHVDHGGSETQEAVRQEISTDVAGGVLNAKFRDNKKQEDNVSEKNEAQREDDKQFSPTANEDKEDVLKFSDPANGKIVNATFPSKPLYENEGSTNFQFMEITNVDDDSKTDNIESFKTTASLKEQKEAMPGLSTEPNEAMPCTSTEKNEAVSRTSAEPNEVMPGTSTEPKVTGVSDSGKILDKPRVDVAEGHAEEVGEKFGQDEQVNQYERKVDANDEVRTKAISEVDDMCDESFEEIGEIGPAFDLTTGLELNEATELTNEMMQGVSEETDTGKKEVNEITPNEEDEIVVWSSEVENALSEAMEQVLNEGKEETLSEQIEQFLNEPRETSLSEQIETSLSEPIVPTLNEGEEKALNDAREQALNKAMEQVLNEAKEQVLRETKEKAMKKATELSFGENAIGFTPTENQTRNEYNALKSTDERLDMSSVDKQSGQLDRETDQPFKEIGEGVEGPIKDAELFVNPGKEIPFSEPHDIEENVPPESGDVMARLNRVAEDMVAALVSEACNSADGKVSETVMNPSLQNDAEKTFQCYEQEAERMLIPPTETDYRGNVSSNRAQSDNIEMISSIRTEEICFMVSDKDSGKSESHVLFPDTGAGEEVNIVSPSDGDTVENVGLRVKGGAKTERGDKHTSASDHTVREDTPTSAAAHREGEDTTMSMSDHIGDDDKATSASPHIRSHDILTATSAHGEGEDMLTPGTDAREETIDHSNTVSAVQGDTQPPVDSTELHSGSEDISAPQQNLDNSKLNARTSPETVRPLKEKRGMCMAALKLSGVVLTGFGCAVAAPFAIAALGFEAGGIAAGSLAASWMSTASTSGVGLVIISALESAGMSGLGLGAQVLIGAVGAGTAGGFVAAVELFKRKSSQGETAHAYGNYKQTEGDAEEIYFHEEADDDNEDESESNNDGSYEDETSDESTDDLTMDIRDEIMQVQDFDQNEKGENNPMADGRELEDKFRNIVDDAQGMEEDKRYETKLAGDSCSIQGQDVIRDSQINNQSIEGKDQQDLCGDISETEDGPRVVCKNSQSKFVSDDPVVDLGDDFKAETKPVDSHDETISGGVRLEALEEAGDDDYTDNPWKSEGNISTP